MGGGIPLPGLNGPVAPWRGRSISRAIQHASAVRQVFVRAVRTLPSPRRRSPLSYGVTGRDQTGADDAQQSATENPELAQSGSCISPICCARILNAHPITSPPSRRLTP